MEKAFDRVSWDFLRRSLKALGFGPDFIKWISLMYNNNPEHPITRTIRVNGYESDSLNIKSGVAQGCSLSPLLFLCIAEGFSRLMESEKGPDGILIGGSEFNLSQYADDTVVLLRDPLTGIPRLIALLDIYCKATGMLVNPKKTEGVTLGADTIKTPNQHPDFPIQWAAQGSYIIGLGLPIGNNFDELDFWKSKYNKFKSRIGGMKTLFLKNQKDRICLETSFPHLPFLVLCPIHIHA